MFCGAETTGGSSASTYGTGEGESFWGETTSIENVNIRQNNDEYKEEMEDDLWMIIDRRRWREYLKIMWLRVLKLKGYLTPGKCGSCKLYCRRLLISISGWLAREGYAKKN